MPSRRLALAVPIALAVLTVAFTVRPLDDFDVWFHLAAGRLMMATGTWPATNTFAYTTPDHSWVDVHWLFQLLLYGAYKLGGANGCIALVVGLMLATVVLLYADARRFAPPALVAVPLAVALAVASIRFVPRPEVLAFALFGAYLWLLDGYPRCGMAIYALVPLQLVWMNAHGTVPVGVGLIGCYWLGATIVAFGLPVPAGWRAASGCTQRQWMHLTIVLVLASAICFVNPWGADAALLSFDLLRSVTGGSILSARIGEFRPPFASGYTVLAYMWAALLAAAVLSFLLNLRHWHLGRLLAVVAFGVLSSRALRNMALLGWVAVPAIAANLGGFLQARAGERWVASPLASRAERRRTKTAPVTAERKGAKTTPPAAAPAETSVRSRIAVFAGGRAAELTVAAALFVLTVSIVTGRFSRFIGVEYGFGTGISSLRFPAGAIEFVREVGIRGRPFNCFAVGGFLAWHLYPEERIFVDGRTQAYPESFFREYFQVMDNPAAWPALAARYQPDYVLLYHVFANRYPLGRYLSSGRGWQLAYYDETAAIFLPTDEAHRETRERAEVAFADVRARRANEPLPAPPSLWGSLTVPVSEIVLQNAYGDFLRAFGKPAEAVTAYQRALFYDPDSSDARFNLAMSYWFTGERERSVLELRDLLRRDPGDERAQKALADALKMSKAPAAERLAG